MVTKYVRIGVYLLIRTLSPHFLDLTSFQTLILIISCIIINLHYSSWDSCFLPVPFVSRFFSLFHCSAVQYYLRCNFCCYSFHGFSSLYIRGVLSLAVLAVLNCFLLLTIHLPTSITVIAIRLLFACFGLCMYSSLYSVPGRSTYIRH